MKTQSFSTLLTLYMRRIHVSVSGVATEIGLSREAVNNWRNGLSMPSLKSRGRLLASVRYLRLTEVETNRLFSAAGFEREFPLQDEPVGDTPFVQSIDALLERLGRSSPYPIGMLLSQAHWGQPPFRAQLLTRRAAVV